MIKNLTLPVRFATADDSEALAVLVDTGPWEVDWSECASGWLVAEDEENVIVGAVCLYLGRPVGRAEMLSIQKSLPPRKKHEIALRLSQAALTALVLDGSQIITILVGFGDKPFKRMLKKHFGAQVTNSGNLLSIQVGEV